MHILIWVRNWENVREAVNPVFCNTYVKVFVNNKIVHRIEVNESEI